MSDNDLVNEIMDGLKAKGLLIINDDFIDQLITTLHANVTAINSLTKIVETENKLLRLAGSLPTGNRQVESLKELSTRIAEIAFNVEDVRNEQL